MAAAAAVSLAEGVEEDAVPIPYEIHVVCCVLGVLSVPLPYYCGVLGDNTFVCSMTLHSLWTRIHTLN